MNNKSSIEIILKVGHAEYFIPYSTLKRFSVWSDLKNKKLRLWSKTLFPKKEKIYRTRPLRPQTRPIHKLQFGPVGFAV